MGTVHQEPCGYIKLSGKIMRLMSGTYDAFMPVLADYCDAKELVMYTDTDGYITKSVYIIKAANSIHTVVSDKVFGFRMGGDEYVMVAVNITEDEAQKIREKWEKSLETLNDEGDVYCVMACGLEYGSGEFNYDELYHRADAQMYLDKKTKKENCQTSRVK